MTEWRGCLALLVGLLATACPDGNSPPCDGPYPAFRVLLTAADGPLPPDTALVVRHGAGTVEFHLDDPHSSSHVLFCGDPARDGGSIAPGDAGPLEVLLCELWTGGAAHVTVTATGYPTLDDDLAPKLESSCLRTKDVELTLERSDAGL